MKKIHMLTIVMLIMLSFVSCRWDIWGSEPIDYGQGLKEPSAESPFTGEKPKSISASKASSTREITVTWEKVPRADYYIIERAELTSLAAAESDIAWKRLLDQPDTTQYVDKLSNGLDPSMKYIYRVRGMSYMTRDRLGTFSDPTAGWLLSCPSDFSATQGEYREKIRLTWKAVDGIAGYRIEWRVDNGLWEPCKEGSSLIPASDEKYEFEPAENLSGRNISFRIQAVSTSDYDSPVSPWSSPVIGYTKSMGAPGQPRDFTVSKAESQTDIMLSWKVPADSTLQWEIYRKSQKDPERRIFSSLEDGVLPEVSGDRMVYSDSDRLKPGVEYTYSVRALKQDDEKQWISGTPTDPRDGKGFLYSPPTKVRDIRIEEKEHRKGFSFTFEGALGEQAGWSYVIYGREDENGAWVPVEGFSAVPASPGSDYRIFVPYDGKEWKLEEFAIKTFNGSVETDVSSFDATGNVISVPRPQKPEGFNATDNMVYPNISSMETVGNASSPDKVYSVSVTFEEQKNVEFYNVKIALPGQETKVVTGLRPQDLDETGAMKIIGNLCATRVGEKVMISIQGVDVLGRQGDWSEPNDGYSAIENDTLIKYMEMFCLKPWEHIGDPLFRSYKADYVDSGAWGYQGLASAADLPKKWQASAIRGKISQNGTGSLSGGITEYSNAFQGHPAGAVTYVATVQGLGGRVSFNYSKFGEVPFMTTDGFFVMVVSMSGSGSCDGGINIKGWYPASVGFDGISVSDQSFVGTYHVKQENGTKGGPVKPNQK